MKVITPVMKMLTKKYKFFVGVGTKISLPKSLTALFILLFFLHSFSLIENVSAQGWSAVGAGMNNAGVLALTIHDGELYAAGSFFSPQNHVARWNGTVWDSLGSGIGGAVSSLASYNGELFATGAFTLAGGSPINNIARWNGIVWDSLTSGLTEANNSNGLALAVYNNELYTGGSFDWAGNVQAYNRAKWNGTNWFALGQNVPGGISAPVLYVYNGRLYCPMNIGGIESWDGINWDSLGSGIGGPNSAVYSMAEYNGELYVGGTFTIAGGIPVNLIAKWNGSQWSDVGGGMTGNFGKEVRTLIVYNGELYAGGKFLTAGGAPANNIAKWNGATWSPVCSGVNNGVRALAILNGELYAGGFFTAAGGDVAKRIAKYSPPFASVIPASAAICNGDPITLYANTGDATAWQWYNNNSPMIGAVTSQLSVNAPGSYSVEVSFPGQCPSVTSAVALVTEGVGPTDLTISSSSTVGCQPNTIYIGYGVQSITLTASATGAVSYLWSTGETTQSISVTAAGTYTVTAYDITGCASVQTPESQVNINIVDARCGNDKKKITLCHYPNGNTSNPQTICIAPSAAVAHLTLHAGDCIGECPANLRSFVKEQAENEIAVYPNPSEGSFTVIGLTSFTTIEVKNILGETIYQQNVLFAQTEIDLSNQPEGIYFLQIKNNEKINTTKLALSR